MTRLALCVMLASACGSGEPTKIDDGLRQIYSIDLDAVPDRRSALEQAATVIRKRLKRGQYSGTVAIKGERLVVDLAAADPEVIEGARALIWRSARFEVKRVDSGSELMRDVYARVPSDPDAIADRISVESDHWVADREHTDAFLVAADREDLDKRHAMRMLTGRRVLEPYLMKYQPPVDRQVVCERLGGQPPRWRSYYVERTAVLTSASIDDAVAWPDPTTNRATVRIALDPQGTKAFADFTRAHVGDKIAILVDDIVFSAPIIMQPITNGKLTITMDESATPRLARDLAISLRSGALPGPIVLEAVAQLEHGKLVYLDENGNKVVKDRD